MIEWLLTVLNLTAITDDDDFDTVMTFTGFLTLPKFPFALAIMAAHSVMDSMSALFAMSIMYKQNDHQSIFSTRVDERVVKLQKDDHTTAAAKFKLTDDQIILLIFGFPWEQHQLDPTLLTSILHL